MLKRLQLLHLADSALPIGSLSHSFGLESMADEGHVSLTNIFGYFSNMLDESLLLDAVYCRCAHARSLSAEDIRYLNQRLSAVRVARESRSASLALGRRFLHLVAALEPLEEIDRVICLDENHLAVAFGFACGVLGFDVEETVMAFLHQSILSAISCAQRLLRLGQTEASCIAWDLKPALLEAVKKSASLNVESIFCFSHLPELASMRHSALPTRLFIS